MLERIRAPVRARAASPMPDINRRQALVPRGRDACWRTTNGTAPGLLHRAGPARRSCCCRVRRGRCRRCSSGASPSTWRRCGERAALSGGCSRITGRSESQVDELAQPVYVAWHRQVTAPIGTSILPVPGQIELHLSVRARARPAEAVPARARRGRTSWPCSARMSSAPTASHWSRSSASVLRARGLARRGGRVLHGRPGVVASDRRSRQLDVRGPRRGVLQQSRQDRMCWASPTPFIERARGRQRAGGRRHGRRRSRERAGVEVGLGITGIAGPAGGSDPKPVGTVVMAVGVRRAARTVRTFRFLGGRAQIKFQASQAALDMVRRLLGGGGVRLFVAVDLEPSRAPRRGVRRGADAWPRALRRGHAGGRGRGLMGAARSNLHLTLRFLGEVDGRRAGDRARVTRFAAPLAAAAFDIELAGVGVFPPSGSPRVVWIGVTPGVEALTSLDRAGRASAGVTGDSAARIGRSRHT